MKTKEQKSKNNIVFGAVVGLTGIACGLWLLISLEKLSGTEFVAFALGFAVIGLIIAFAAEVQEFSIAGNGVKLKELRSEAEKTIEELKEARTEVFRFLIMKSTEYLVSDALNSVIDERVDPFIKLFKQIEKFECIEALKLDIKKVLHILMFDQYMELKDIHKKEKNNRDDFTNEDQPTFLYIKLNSEIIMERRKQCLGDDIDIESDLIKGIECYAELYAIKVKLDKLENEL